jgi:hypothetical protein
MSLDNKFRYALKLKNAETGEYLKEDQEITQYSVFTIVEMMQIERKKNLKQRVLRW